MKVRLKNILIVFAIILCSTYSFSQSSLSINLSGVGYHPFDIPNYKIFENSIGTSGVWVVEPCAILEYQKFIRLTHTSIQVSQGIYSDAAARFAGFTGFYLKRKFYHKYKHSFSLALGGAYLYRRSWSEISQYTPESDFNAGEKFETRFSFSAELNYYLYITNRSDFAISVLYGHQHETFTFMLGYRFWLNPNVNLRECDSCGDKKFNRKPIRSWIKRHIKI
jgi:hypothetical protein